MARWEGWSSGPWGRGSWGTAVDIAEPTQVSATGQIGRATVVADAPVVVSGVSATVILRDVIIEADNNANTGSIFAVGDVGDVTEFIGEANVYPTGVFGTGQLGEAESETVNLVPVTGVQATGYLGVAEPDAEGTAFPTGVEATGGVGNGRFILVWGEIDTSQDANWKRIAS